MDKYKDYLNKQYIFKEGALELPELQAKMRMTLEEKLLHLKEDTYNKDQGGDAHQVTIGLYKYFLLLRYEKVSGMMDDVKLAAKVG